MWVFRSVVDTKERGTVWSPQIKTFCPYCTAGLAFYTKLHDNRCKSCNKPLPFDSRMARGQQERVEYHVEAEAEGEHSKQVNVHFMCLWKRD